MEFAHRDRILSTLDTAISVVYDETDSLSSINRAKLRMKIEGAKKTVYDEYALKMAIEQMKAEYEEDRDN